MFVNLHLILFLFCSDDTQYSHACFGLMNGRLADSLFEPNEVYKYAEKVAQKEVDEEFH